MIIMLINFFIKPRNTPGDSKSYKKSYTICFVAKRTLARRHQ